MANKKTSKRQRDIKSKLVAAICMLLVSSIMMVSSTYAWFTLSTAPEVTGINTAVGSNGNLEMALLPANGSLDGISTGTSDSIAIDTVRNLTWGNLVDLDNTAYGLANITLYPASLNMEGDKMSTGSILETPAYGADGRMSGLNANTVTAIKGENGFTPLASGTEYGVRAVGSVSGMTDRQLAYRNAKASADAAAAQAAKKASDSLTARGSALAGLAIKKANSGTYDADDVAVLQGIIDDLTASDGVLAKIETAYKQYILAFAASGAEGNTDLSYSAVKSIVEDEDNDLSDILDEIGELSDTASVPQAISEIITTYETSKAKVTTAQQKLNELAPLTEDKTSYTWEELSPILSLLANPEYMELNGYPVSTALNNQDALLQSYFDRGGLFVTITSGGGIYADIADHCGDYTASISLTNVRIGTAINLAGPIPATMNTDTQQSTLYLDAFGAAAMAAGAPASGAQGTMPISDTFGYIIDLAFRTNAADSDLLLQADAVNRIYEGEEGVDVTTTINGEQVTESTMGGGAYMEFESALPSFGTQQIKDLMDGIRIVFFNPDDGTIYATAMLDTANADTTTTGGVKAPIALYTLSTETTYVSASEGATHVAETTTTTTYESATGDEALYVEDSNAEGGYRLAVDDETATHKQVSTTTTTYREAQADETATHKAVNAGTPTIIESKKIMGLNQNTATKLSVLVYLDGSQITNAEVAVSGNSVTGKMNLQFASSVELSPMNYTPLHGTETEE